MNNEIKKVLPTTVSKKYFFFFVINVQIYFFEHFFCFVFVLNFEKKSNKSKKITSALCWLIKLEIKILALQI